MITTVLLGSVKQTGAEMERLVRSYSNDVAQLAHLPLNRFFDLVKNLKYIPDPQGREFVSRPAESMRPDAMHRDCDDKAIIIGAYLYLKHIPFRFVAVANGDVPLHHVLVQAKINNRARIIDATYRWNRLFHFKPIKKFHPITGWIL